ncbi:SPP1 gp7 family putative phage head morphogenesis protein [Neisseria sp. HSC-16F19]|nr:phage minor head protein [Neisseria sp. HSC-16F19]MCP2041675.1 SPP1 gp7 family putative phage head morphogenesis protein [Neisseria sp. HSC-16F19]
MKPQPNEILLKAIHPNLGVEAAYRKSLKRLLRDMRRDVDAMLAQHYPQGLAQDGIADGLQAALSRLIRLWLARLDKLAPHIAETFATQSMRHTDRAFQAALRDAGFTVRFRHTTATQTAFEAALGGNVGLIRSIGQQYLSRVENSVWRSVNAGYDMGRLAQELRRDFGISQRRAAFIARDQTNKAKAAIEKARRQEMGITEAIWLHSHAGKEPRPSHVAANGKRFEVAKGMYLDGKWVQPGEEINCRCASRSVLKGWGT